MADLADPFADVVAPLAAPIFALVPSAATSQILDFTTRTGLAVYTSNVRSLYRDDDERFDLLAGGLQTFLSLVGRRVGSAAWDISIPTDLADVVAGPTLNFLAHHGEIALSHLHAYDRTYIGTACRMAQDNMMFHEMLLESLSLVAVQKVMSWASEWRLSLGGGTTLPSALSLLKVIIRESFIDSNATTRILREQLSSMPFYLNKLGGRIPDLNQHVLTTVDQLAARGETSTDLVANLFKGYLSSHDRVFTNYIEKKQEDFDEGNNLTANQLMTLADNKYKILVQTDKWMTPTSEEKKIVALETKLAELSKKPAATTPPKSKGEPRVHPAAKLANPGQAFIDANKTKDFNGVKHWWCTFHKRFVCHQSKDCKLKPQGAPAQDPTTEATPGERPPSLQVSEGLIMDE